MLIAGSEIVVERLPAGMVAVCFVILELVEAEAVEVLLSSGLAIIRLLARAAC